MLALVASYHHSKNALLNAWINIQSIYALDVSTGILASSPEHECSGCTSMSPAETGFMNFNLFPKNALLNAWFHNPNIHVWVGKTGFLTPSPEHLSQLPIMICPTQTT